MCRSNRDSMYVTLLLKKNMKIIITLIVSLLVINSTTAADNTLWKPQASFQLEDSDLQKTMLFISGMTYGLTEYTQQLVKSGMPRLFCPSGTGIVGSQLAFEILNERYRSKRITSEQATAAVIAGLRERFPCK
jgi:hypothetical protein